MSRAFFDPSTEHVMGLGQEGAVYLLHDLIYAELARLKLHAEKITIPNEIDIADGGIDAEVLGIKAEPESQILFEGETYYQSKSGDSVELNDSGLRDIVLTDTKPKTKRLLKPKIKEIAEKNGNLVLFLPGISKPKIDEAEKRLLGIIKETVPGTTLRVRILQADNIVGVLRPHLALKMRLMRGNTSFIGITYDDWAREPSMSKSFEHDEKRDAQVENIRSLLLKDEVNDIRVSGFPGNGKTKSVLEAVSTPELKPQVVYFAKPSQALDTNNLQELSYEEDLTGIIIIDECDRTSHASALAIVQRSKSNLKLVTIYNEDGNEIVGDVRYIDLNTSEKLSEDTIKRIIKSYISTAEDAGRWAQYCDGSPRMAHMIGENLQYNSADILKNPGYDEAMELCLANRDQIGSPAFNERKQVLMWLSLFTKFGWSTVHASEREFILAKIKRLENMPEGKVEQIIKDLKDRKILQGDKTLYISPRLLQVRAWKWWWEQYGPTFDTEKFWREKDDEGNVIPVSSQLVDWFNDMFQYAAEAPGAAEVVKKLLAKGGPLENEENLIQAIGSNFFLRLTEANPGDTLALLSRWLKDKSDSDLEALSFDRQRLTRSLEAMAVWREHFVEATRLLLRIARTEKDHTYSNNSEGTFSDMFSNGYGKVATTEAPPPERMIVLKEALASDNPKEQLLAIQGVYKSLEMDHFSKMVGPEIQGLKREPKLWLPATWGEFWDAMQGTWDLLVARIPTLRDEPLEKAVGVLSDRLRGLVRIHERGLKFLEDFIRLTNEGYIPYEEALKTVSLILRYEKELKEDIRARLEEFYASLEGDDVGGKLKRYVATDVPEDWWDDDGQKVNLTLQKLEELAKAVLQNHDILAENPWLFTYDAKNGYSFGLALATADTDYKLLPKLIQEQKKSTGENASVFFLSGYLQGIQKRDINKAHEVIDKLKTDDYFLTHILELIWRTELDEYTGTIVLELLKQNKVNYREMARFKLGGGVKHISDQLFDEWIKDLLGRNDVNAHATAIDLFMSHYVFQEKKELPKALTKKLLSMKTLGSQATRQISNDIEWDWSQVAMRYIEQYPDDVDFLINFMAQYYGRKGSILESHHEAAKVLSELATLKPEMVWDKVAGEITSERHDTYGLERWLQGETWFGSDRGAGAIQALDKKMLLSWIDEDPKERAPLVASMVPHDFGFDNKPDDPCWLQIMLDKYGADKRVISAVNANLWSEGYSGPASQHYAAKLEDIKRFKTLNKDSVNIQNWANEYIPGLEQHVEQSKIREEREWF